MFGCILGTSTFLFWYWCYYPHQLRGALSSVCGIFFTLNWDSGKSYFNFFLPSQTISLYYNKMLWRYFWYWEHLQNTNKCQTLLYIGITWINNEAVCRIAPATQCLSIIIIINLRQCDSNFCLVNYTNIEKVSINKNCHRKKKVFILWHLLIDVIPMRVIQLSQH